MTAVPTNPQPDDLLPLGVRRALYILGLIATVIAPLLGVSFPEYRDGFVNAGIVLQGAALGTAIAYAKSGA